MVAILELERIQVKGEIVRIMTGIRLEEDKTSTIKERTCTRSRAQYKSTWYSRLMIRISQLIHWYSRLVLQTESKGLRFLTD